jgi:predicted  nucleic acid-binding Zn-ribbon protein
MLFDEPEFQALLLLHGRDRRKIGTEQELMDLPKVREMVKNKIEIEKETIASAQIELREFETKANTFANLIASIETKISQQKTKQLKVKRQEEYQALENEIKGLQEQMNADEDEQLETLMKVDDARATLLIAEGKHTDRVHSLETELEELNEREKVLQEEIIELGNQIKTSGEEMEPTFLREYERVKKVVRRPPYVVPVEDQKCTGCNLRVSNDIVSSILVEEKLTICDQCGRIVYIAR